MNLPANADKTDRKERISPRVRQAIESILNGTARSQRQAARECGLSEEHLCRALKKPQVRAFYERRTRETLASAIPKAAGVLVHLMENGQSEHVRKDVATHILSLAGIIVKDGSPPLSVAIGLQQQAGYIIKPKSPDGSEAVVRSDTSDEQTEGRPYRPVRLS